MAALFLSSVKNHKPLPKVGVVPGKPIDLSHSGHRIPDYFLLITNGNGKTLYYFKGGFRHKALVVTEGFQFQTNKALDSELALQSEL